eukprot:gene10250-12570_t
MRVLMVEDEAGIARDVLRALTHAGFAAEHVANGAAAWERGGTEPFDAAILDLNLPDTTGFEILTRLSAHPTLQAVPVVMLSSSDDLDDAVKCLELGAVHYLTKPVQAHPFCDICSDIGCPLSIKPLAVSDSPH